MFIPKRIGYRAFQIGFRAALPILPYHDPEAVSFCSVIGGILAKEKTNSALVVTDAGIVKSGLVDPLEAVLQQNGVDYVIYDKTQPNPTVKNVEDALILYRLSKCDTIIAIGGGSAMDCAKAIGAVAYPQKSQAQMGSILRVFRKIPTLIAIPTTAGTGRETTLAAIITDGDTRHKYALRIF